MTDQELIRAFHIFWDSYPVHVRLIRRDRTVLAGNKAAEEKGMVAGTHCFPNENGHPGCLGNLALDAGRAEVRSFPNGRQQFWIPVQGREDVFVHFSCDPNDPIWATP